MTPFQPVASGDIAMTQFNWQTPGVAARALRETALAPPVIVSGVMAPLRDLRQALGPAANTSGRMIQGLGQSTVHVPLRLFNMIAINFVASCPRQSCQEGFFHPQELPSKAKTTGCSAG